MCGKSAQNGHFFEKTEFKFTKILAKRILGHQLFWQVNEQQFISKSKSDGKRFTKNKFNFVGKPSNNVDFKF